MKSSNTPPRCHNNLSNKCLATIFTAFIFLSNLNTDAQGMYCDEALSVQPDTCLLNKSLLTSAQQDAWYVFTATDSSMRFSIYAHQGHIHDLYLYGDSCANLHLLAQDSASSDTASTISMTSNGLSIGQKYYLKLGLRLTNCQVKCQTSIVEYDLCIESMILALNCGLAPPSCDYISNGSFEMINNPCNLAPFNCNLSTTILNNNLCCWTWETNTPDLFSLNNNGPNCPFSANPRTGDKHIHIAAGALNGPLVQQNWVERIQTLVPGLVPGCTYIIEYYLQRISGTEPVNFYPTFQQGTNAITSGASVTQNIGPYVHHSWTFAIPIWWTNTTPITLILGSHTTPNGYTTQNDFYLDDVSLRHIINLTVTPDQLICGSNPIQLTATTNCNMPITYSWTPTTNLNNPNIPNPIFTPPSANGTYTLTVTATDPNGCSTSKIINIQNSTPIASINSSGLCLDPDITLNASVSGGTTPFTWLWSTGQTNPNITVTQSGIYSVTATSADGCTASSTFNVPNQTPMSVNIATNASGNPPNICNPPITLTANPSGGSANNIYSYAWSNSATTQSVISNNAGTFEVTVTDDIGCSATDNIVVAPCCYGDYDFSNLTTQDVVDTWPWLISTTIETCQTNSQNILIFNAPLNSTIAINGVFSVNGNISFNNQTYQGFVINNAHILMGADARIETNLPLIYFGLSACNIENCNGYLWDQIYCNSKALYVYNCSIQDGKKAFVLGSNNNSILIRNNTFDLNYKDIVVQSGASYPVPDQCHGIIKNNFQCTGTLQPELLTNTPPGDRTRIGVQVINTKRFFVGIENSVNIANTFDNMDIGIYQRTTDSSLTNPNIINKCYVINNHFSNINGSYIPGGSPFNNIAIYSKGLSNIKYNLKQQELFIGKQSSPLINAQNTFDNCNYGVFLRGICGATIINNVFNDMHQTGIMAFDISSPGFSIPFVAKDNYFNSFDQGINLLKATITMRIRGNWFNNISPQPPFSGLPNQSNNAGIIVQSVAAQNITSLYGLINKNLLLNTVTGIWSINTPGVRINNNSVTILNTNAEINQSPYPHTGILLQNSNKSYLNSNKIQRLFYQPNASLIHNLIGIQIENSNDVMVYKNTVRRFGSGINATSACQGTAFFCNKLQQDFSGFYFDNATLSNQGAPNNASGNKWIGNIGQYRMDGVATNSPAIQWYYQYGPIFNPNPIPSSLSINITLFSGAQPGKCTIMVNPNKLAMRDSLYGKTVRGQSNYVPNNGANRRRAGLWAMLHLLNDTLIWLGDTSDQTFATFVDTTRQSSIGMMHNIDSLAAANEINTAAALNNTLPANCQQEINARLVNDIYLNTWALGQYRIDAADLSVLNTIACQDPLTGGMAVYKARVLLRHDYHCNSGNKTGGKPGRQLAAVAPEKALSFPGFEGKLYPNPNNGSAFFAYAFTQPGESVLRISDMRGSTILRRTLAPGNRVVQLKPGLSPGIYLVTVAIDGREVYRVKMAVLRN